SHTLPHSLLYSPEFPCLPLYLLFNSPIPHPPTSTLFPYTTLFRSEHGISTGAVKNPETMYRAAEKLINRGAEAIVIVCLFDDPEDRKSTRLNSSHVSISYAVFCLKKKKKNQSNEAL